MKSVISEKYDSEKIQKIITNFDTSGKILSRSRNEIKIFELDGIKVNVKSFKVPNLINKITYKYFRKSKAERSFTYAQILQEKNIGTPTPIAYAEENTGSLFGRSYYLSKHIMPDLTYRELVSDPEYPDHENILRAFTKFTFELHEKQIQFQDHSPGNTLIQRSGNVYHFFLVDLNRMNFKELNFEERMLNFSRLTPKKEMVEIMADEYSKLIDKPTAEVFEKMWFYTSSFQQKYWKKQRLKTFFKLGKS